MMKVKVKANGIVIEPDYPLTSLADMLYDVIDSLAHMEYDLDDKVKEEFPITIRSEKENARLTIELALVEIEETKEASSPE